MSSENAIMFVKASTRQKLKQQSELLDFKEHFQDIFPDNFYSVLVFICLSISNRFDCMYVLYLFMLKPHFNLLLLAFNIASTPYFEQIYSTKNTFYLPVVLQCAMKVDYLYNEMCQSDFTTLSIEHEKIDQYPGNSSKNTILKNTTGDEDETDSEDFDFLFTLPEKKPMIITLQSANWVNRKYRAKREVGKMNHPNNFLYRSSWAKRAS